MTKPFVLRSPNGPHKGRYFISGDYQGINWTDDINLATRHSIRDAYGHTAAALDMLNIALVPELVDGTEEDCQQFGELAAKDMLQNPQPATIDLFQKLATRRSPTEPLYDLPPDFPPTDRHMSVWEWMARVFHRG